MAKIRVLAVDDSVVVRRVISDVIGAEPDFEMAGVAANGRIALSMLTQVAPDVIILDVDMPELDGLATLEEIRRRDPRLRVLMFSALTERGAEATLDALFKGATDYLTKPARMGSAAEATRAVRDELLPKIRAVCGIRTPRATPPAVTLETARRERTALPAMRAEVVAIGASTGGPNALQTVLTELPRGFPVPVLVVQHMPPIFTRHLARQLSLKLNLEVNEAAAGDEVRPGRVYIAPGGHHMVVVRDGEGVRVDTNQNPPEHSCRPAVDVLFRSVAAVYGSRALGVVLTGMGRDGLRGCEAIFDRGGQVVAQDQATSVVWGMPGFVANAQLADAVLPLDRIGREILDRVRLSSHAKGGGAGSDGRAGARTERGDEA